MSRLAALVFVLSAALLAPPADARRNHRNDLIRVTSPPLRGSAPAHPFVNVIVFFDARADPLTFRARIGRNDVTSRFVAIAGADGTPGKQGTIEASLLRPGHAVNHLRLEVRSVPIPTKGRRTKRLRDVDRVRFRAVQTIDQPPVAQFTGPDIVFPGIPVQFSARPSSDPDLDQMTFHWDFGDTTTSDERDPTHVFPDTSTDLTVQLTVSDGQRTASNAKTLFSCPDLDPGRAPGTLKIEADAQLEFGSVAPGTSATRTLTVRNLSTDPASQLKGRLEVGPVLPPPAADATIAHRDLRPHRRRSPGRPSRPRGLRDQPPGRASLGARLRRQRVRAHLRRRAILLRRPQRVDLRHPSRRDAPRGRQHAAELPEHDPHGDVGPVCGERRLRDAGRDLRDDVGLRRGGSRRPGVQRLGRLPERLLPVLLARLGPRRHLR
ncbi:MAG: PKD domain-containing protein [Deltaproteobacteria bacterium]|nr:MAG: PKD domain-containing protein [Deltaproteobacteria bacterium]